MTDEQTGKPRGNKRFAVGTAAGVITGGIVIVAALNLVQPRTAVTAVPAGSPSAGVTSSVLTPTALPPTVSTPSPALPSVGEPSGTPTSVSPSVAPTSTTSTTSASKGEVLTSLPRLSYVAVFRWLPKGQYSAAQAAQFAADNARGGQDVVAIDGNLIQKTGYWGIGVANLKDFADATATCKAMGFGTSGSDCFRRAVL